MSEDVGKNADDDAGASSAAGARMAINRPKTSTMRRVGSVAAVALGVGVLGYSMLVPPPKSPVKTSDSEQFQKPAVGTAFGALTPSKKAGDQPDVFGHLDEALQKERHAAAKLAKAQQDQIDALQAKIAALAAAPTVPPVSAPATAPDTSTADALKKQIDDLRHQLAQQQATSDQRIAAMNASIKAQADAAQAQADAAQRTLSMQSRAKEQAALEARINSNAVVYDNGARSSSAMASNGPSDGTQGQGAGDRGQKSTDATARDFVQGGADAPAKVQHAQPMGDPAHTILQGTMIQATLENAVESALPGQLTAVVNYPVYSFDQSRILVPAGSRLFGSYSSDVTVGQSRVLVAWTRLVTPSGGSVLMKAFGGDDAGRSGITGDVHNRFGLKFGSAMLISLIAAAPSLAAAQTSNTTVATGAQAFGTGLQTATNAAIGAYVGLPPVITVEPGASVTVMVDRDLLLY